MALIISSVIANADDQIDKVRLKQLAAAELQLVEIYLNGTALTDFQEVLQTPEGRLWLPLVALMKAAEAEVEILPNGLYKVTLSSIGARLRINSHDWLLTVNDQMHDWRPGDLILKADQLFIANGLMTSILDLTARLSDDGLRVDVESSQPLPADLRRLRENRWRLINQKKALPESNYHPIILPYQLWGTPRGDVQITLTGHPENSGIQAVSNGSVTLEAGYLSHQLFFTADDKNALRSLRWTAGRTSPAGNIFGIKTLHQLELGDITPFKLPLQGGAAQGRGIAFSTAPLDRPELFDVTRFEGDALPGWDAELYRGADLIDFQRIPAEGRYYFEDVPLIFGKNNSRVMLYGPQGEVREERLARSIATGQLVPGELHLRGSLVQTQRPLLPIETLRRPTGEQLTLRADYGLLPRLTTSVFLGLDEQQEINAVVSSSIHTSTHMISESTTLSQRNIGMALRPAFGPLTSELVLITQNGGRSARQLSTSGVLGGLYLSGRQQHYTKDFISRERTVFGRQVDDSLRLRFGHAIGNWGSLSLDFERLDFSAAKQRKTFTVGLRHRLGPISLAHEVRQYREEEFKRKDYRLLGSHRQGKLSSRFQLHASNVDHGRVAIRSFGGSLDWQITPQHFIGIGLGHERIEHRFNLQLRSGWQFATGRLSFSVSMDDSHQWAAGLTLGVGLGMESGRGLSLIPPSAVQGGAVSVKVFHDHKANRQFEAQNDPTYDSVGFLVDGRRHSSVTNIDGLTVLRHLPIRHPVQIMLDNRSQSDPFMVPTLPRVTLQARPGQTHHLTFALKESALISGYVLRGKIGIPDLSVIATHDNGITIETTRTLSDGYFSFETVSPGTWLIGTEPDELAQDWVTTKLRLTVNEGVVSDGHILQVLSTETEQEQEQEQRR